MALVCSGCLFVAWHMRGGGKHTAGIWKERMCLQQFFHSYFKRHKYVFLYHYSIFIPSNASSDMHSHTVHAVSHPWLQITFVVFYHSVSGFGGLEVACWPLVPKFAGSHPAEAVGILGQKKILSTPSFGGEVKPSVPRRSFTACKRSLNVTWKSEFRQNYRTLLAHSSTFRHWVLLHGDTREDALWRKLYV